MEEYNNYQDMNSQLDNNAPKSGSSSGLATAALVLGICSLVLICCGGGFLLGGVGIILALLSRGSGEMNGTAKAGLGLSIAGLVVSLTIFTFYFVTLIQSGEFRSLMRSYNDYYNYYDDYDDYEDYDDYYDSDGPLNDLLDRYYNGPSDDSGDTVL